MLWKVDEIEELLSTLKHLGEQVDDFSPQSHCL